MALILTEKKDSTGIITLNHADKRNALSEALIMEITAALELMNAKNAVVCAVQLTRAARGAAAKAETEA